MADAAENLPLDDGGDNGGNITARPFSELLSERYLAYALSTIMSRSLPDVRDGLKPVHRRILFAMQGLQLGPGASFKKSARVVGDSIGRYHPHGDQAVYDAMVRLAQDFAMRYPLVEGQGNFGDIDGEKASAMRYTEARLTRFAELLMDGLEEDAVDFRPTYDGEGAEPALMPAGFPNLLANGASGIAVGMATNIPPHNLPALCDALKALIDGDPETRELVEMIGGPDFPTGGVLVEEKESLVQAYEAGKGQIRLRARWYTEDLKQGQWQIVVTEMPYQVPKARLVERLADLIEARKLPLLDNVRDESAEDIRLVLIPKSRNVDPQLLMESIFKNTDLDTRFAMNLTVLDASGKPRVMGLKDILRAYLEHRQIVLIRRCRHRLSRIEQRLEILEGYQIVYLNIDEVIRIIRESDHPKPDLIARFELTDNQAEAILNMRLRSLRKLEEEGIRKEHEDLTREKGELEALLASESRQWAAVGDQIGALRTEFGPETFYGRRRTEIAAAPVEMDMPTEALVEREPITVVLSQKGWVRAVKGHQVKPEELKYKEGDGPALALACQTTDRILLPATDGRFYALSADKLPSGRGYGDPVRLLVDLPNTADPICMMLYDPARRLLVASADGKGFVVKQENVLAQTKSGKMVMTGGMNFCREIRENDTHLAVIGENRRLLIFPLEEVPEMTRGRGVILQKYKNGGIADLRLFNWNDGLTFRYGSGERTEDPGPWLAKRGQVGRLPPHGFPRNNHFSGA